MVPLLVSGYCKGGCPPKLLSRNGGPLQGAELIAKVITGIPFKDGVEVPKENPQEIAA
jgi:hypothetical protein